MTEQAINVTLPTGRVPMGTRYVPGQGAIPLWATESSLDPGDQDFAQALSQEFGGKLPSPNEFQSLVEKKYGQGQEAEGQYNQARLRWRQAYEDGDRLLQAVIEGRVPMVRDLQAKGIDPYKYFQAEVTNAKKMADAEFEQVKSVLAKQMTESRTMIDKMMTKYVDMLSKIKTQQEKKREKTEITPETISTTMKEESANARMQASLAMKQRFGATVNPVTGELDTGNKGFKKKTRDAIYDKDGMITGYKEVEMSDAEVRDMYQRYVNEALVELVGNRMGFKLGNPQLVPALKNHIASYLGVEPKYQVGGTQQAGIVPDSIQRRPDQFPGLSAEDKRAIIAEEKEKRKQMNASLGIPDNTGMRQYSTIMNAIKNGKDILNSGMLQRNKNTGEVRILNPETGTYEPADKMITDWLSSTLPMTNERTQATRSTTAGTQLNSAIPTTGELAGMTAAVQPFNYGTVNADVQSPLYVEEPDYASGISPSSAYERYNQQQQALPSYYDYGKVNPQPEETYKEPDYYTYDTSSYNPSVDMDWETFLNTYYS